MVTTADKIMFEIYREDAYAGQYRVVYFTELHDHERDVEFNRAMRGTSVFDGYLRYFGKEDAKKVIKALLARLNNGEQISEEEFRRLLDNYLVE